MKLLSRLTAAGTVLTNTTDEGVLASYEFPADFFVPGKVISGRAFVRVVSANSTDTLTLKARLGPVALTGTAFYESTAINAEAEDISVLSFELVCRDADASSTIVATAIGSDPDAAGVATDAQAAIIGSLDLAGASQYLAITGDWSVAHADNQVQIESLTIYEAV
jgi:hypothetical protein